jgi:septum formation protein
LALEKAREVLKRNASSRSPNAVVIAADTIVVSPDRRKILGKPGSKADALRMLRSIVGKTHFVYTGYCILHGKRAIQRVVVTSVTMKRLSPKGIRNYFSRGESMDKAGAYAAQGFGNSSAAFRDRRFR